MDPVKAFTEWLHENLRRGGVELYTDQGEIATTEVTRGWEQGGYENIQVKFDNGTVLDIGIGNAEYYE